jgi:hypothetical protein
MSNKKQRILLYDLETSPILAYVWGVWQQDVGQAMIEHDWHLLSWSAKWLGEKKVFYMDQRDAPNVDDDKKLLLELKKLLNEADVVITHNGKKFDQKKMNARMALNNIQPPSPYKHIDTLQLARKHFAFTSNRLEHLAEKLCTKYKKSKHKKFEGFTLWRECLKDNPLAWKEMEKYNKMDVLALEELYNVLAPWGTGVNLEVYKGKGAPDSCDACGGAAFVKHGRTIRNDGTFQRYRCKDCGAEYVDTTNLRGK